MDKTDAQTIIDRKSTFRKAVHALRRVSDFATDLTKVLPDKDDSWLQVLVKGVAALGVVEQHVFSAGMDRPEIDVLFDAMGVEVAEHWNDYFAQLFVQEILPIDRRFREEKIKLDPYSTVHVVRSELGLLFLLHTQREGSEWFSGRFWTSKGFDFEGVFSGLWKKHGERLHLELVRGLMGTKACVSPMPMPNDPLLGSAGARMSRMLEKHEKRKEVGAPGTYILAGPPGTGKTTYVMHMARELNGRVLRFDAGAWTRTSTSEVDLLLRCLFPDIILVDDIDHLHDIDKSMNMLLTLTADLQLKHPEVTVMFICNDIGKLSKTLVRPGRIDLPEIFTATAADERREVLLSYAARMGVDLHQLLDESGARLPADAVLDKLVDASDGLTMAYFKYAISELRVGTLDEVLALLAWWRAFQGSEGEEEVEDEGREEPTPRRVLGNQSTA